MPTRIEPVVEEPDATDSVTEADPIDAARTQLHRNVEWVTQMLKQHYVGRRSIHFVLDCKFEHYRLHLKCTELI
jgi:hypothetical protein